MPVNKNDVHARNLWGGRAYDAIPKSVFATLVWHLANRASGYADNLGAAESTMLDELQILTEGGHIPAAQGNRAAKAIMEDQGEIIADYRKEFGDE